MDAFVPLLESLKPALTAPLSTPTNPPATAPFQPFAPASGERLANPSPGTTAHRAAASPSEGKSATASPPCIATPKLSFERDGDQIRRIRIECTCGQLIELDCT